jgi:hypothetical protein
MTAALPIFVLGDGHAKYLISATWHKLFAPRKVEVCEVAGATAIPGRNPNVAGDATAKFRKFIEKRPADAIVVIHMGEADCGYVMWHRADKFNEPVAEQLDRSVAAYFEFVDELISKGFKHIVITGATLPTITDEEQAAGVVKSRDSITATQRERTDLTLDYNARLKEQAGQRRLLYTDITEDVLDPETGLARGEFRNANPAESIMNLRIAGPLWADRLNACFESLNPLDAVTYGFIAIRASFAKGLVVHSKELAPHLKIATGKDDRLVAKLLHDTGEFLVISDAVLNGQPLGGLIRLIHKADWQQLEPVTAEPAPAVIAEAPVTETIAPPPAAKKRTRLAKAKERVFGKKTTKKKK